VKALLVLLVRTYRTLVAPLLPECCIYTPTCSEYALEAIQRHGAARGTALAFRRVLRCHPWARGGEDPVP
jgi:putative membrane protein insertion efficiency factor